MLEALQVGSHQTNQNISLTLFDTVIRTPTLLRIGIAGQLNLFALGEFQHVVVREVLVFEFHGVGSWHRVLRYLV